MVKVGVVGGSGYSGGELMRLLAGHPGFELAVATSREQAGTPVSQLWPGLRGAVDLAFVAPDLQALTRCELVFFATPNGTAMQMARALLAEGVKIVDLAADFRLRSAQEWERWYKMPHACPELLEQAVYGLPELHRDRIRTARLVANPGCYPTAVTLGFLPLIEAGAADCAWLIADAKSGVSGAGRKLDAMYLYSEATENFQAYGTGGHRHGPEILQNLRDAGARDPVLDFIPHLTPMSRGIHATLYARLLDTGADLQALYERRYRAEPFVDVMPARSHPQTRSVRGSNLCRIAVHRRGEDRAVVLSVIDNLVKGAAGQAVHNANLMCGMQEADGLPRTGEVP